MKPSELLEKFGWCHGCYATDKDGREVASSSGEAVSFCAYGAINRCFGCGSCIEYKYSMVLSEKCKQKYGTPSVVECNDQLIKEKGELISLMKEVEEELKSFIEGGE